MYFFYYYTREPNPKSEDTYPTFKRALLFFGLNLNGLSQSATFIFTRAA